MTELILKFLFTKGIQKLWKNKDMLWLYLRTLLGSYRNKEIRFSISYIFKIRIPDTDKYLLVLNRRIPNQLQPVGGVYKRYGDDKLFDSWGYQIDNSLNGLGTDERSSQDLRFRVKGSNVIKVIRWFEEGKEREISANREFIEELLNTRILKKELFQNIVYKNIRRVSENLKYSKFHNCYEVLIYDVIEFMPDSIQSQELINLAKTSNNLNKGYAVVSSEDISQLRYMEDNVQKAKIGDHTRLIINKTI